MTDTQDYKIQWLDDSGWRTTEIFSSKGGGDTISKKMQEAQRYYKGYRIRCVDGNGRMVDML
jgi:hypothetical protein